MQHARNSATSSLDAIQSAIADSSMPPVHLWEPAQVRDVDIRILKNGDWLYQGSKIDRTRMVQLFSSVLRKDDDGATYLVTPVEKLRITVDDAPFTAVLLEEHGEPAAPTLVFTTNVGDRVIADKIHQVHVEYSSAEADPAPYILVRDRLRALISRTVFYQLAELAEERDGRLGVMSRGCFMPLDC